jgi:predicted nucleic acid-binding protein
MRIQTLYLDTSVIGGYHDSEWMADTRELWAQAKAGQWRLMTSIIAEAELTNAPSNVRELFKETFDASNILDTSIQIEELAQAYLAAAVVSPKFADDALHVAMATVHRVRFLVSWNFKHLVNVRREDGFNAVNLLQGWPPIRIVSPKEIIYADGTLPD